MSRHPTFRAPEPLIRAFDAARDRWLLSRLRRIQPAPPSWPLEPAHTSRAEIIWPEKYPEKWLGPLLHGLRGLVTVRHSPSLVMQGPVALGVLRTSDVERPFAVDISDYHPVDESIVDQVCCYFKWQHDIRGYPFGSVVPGGYVGADMAVYRFASVLRSPSAARAPTLYGRFNMSLGTRARTRALEVLRDQHRIDFVGEPRTIRYSRYLEEASRSALCLDLPGNGNLCFRLVDYLAIGAAIVTMRPKNALPVPLRDGHEAFFFKEDLSDLVDLCEDLLARPDELIAARAAAASYFDRFLHSSQLAGYYLSTLFDRAR